MIRFGISAEDIGGSAHGATNINVTGIVTTSTYGTSSTFFDKDVSGNNPYGVCKKVDNVNKVYGTTYKIFQIEDSDEIYTSWYEVVHALQKIYQSFWWWNYK